jgi:hypothetical protein
VGGLLAAAVVTLAGAFGELWVVYQGGEKLDLGGLDDYVWVPALLAAGLLFVYGFRTLVATLKHGINPPKPKTPAPSETIEAAKLIVEALKAYPDIDEEKVDAAVKAVTDGYPPFGTSPGDDYPRPERSAML